MKKEEIYFDIFINIRLMPNFMKDKTLGKKDPLIENIYYYKNLKLDERFYGGRLKAISKIKNHNYYVLWNNNNEIIAIAFEWSKLNLGELVFMGNHFKVEYDDEETKEEFKERILNEL